MIRIILKLSALGEEGMPSEMAIQLLENLFDSCSNKKSGNLRLHDPILVWELYNLVEYSPPPRRSSVVSSDDDGIESDHTPLVNGSATHEIPR